MYVLTKTVPRQLGSTYDSSRRLWYHHICTKQAVGLLQFTGQIVPSCYVPEG
jgi:hypothetical protein